MVIFTTFGSVNGIARDGDCPPQVITDGVADLRCWDGKSKIDLSGEWQLDYQAYGEDITYQGLAMVPQRWKGMSPALPYLGRGVYRLKLLLNSPVDHLAIKLPRTNMANKLVIVDATGKETVVFDTGKTDFKDRALITMYMPIIDLPKLGEGSEIIYYVNNSESVHGGIEVAPLIGAINNLVSHDQIMKFIVVAISVVLLMFFLFNLIFWWVRERDWAQFTLGLLALDIAIRQLAVSGVLYDFFPDSSIRVDDMIGWGTFFAGVLLGFGYFRAIYPNLIPRWMPVIIYSTTLIGIVILLIMPVHYVQAFGEYYRPLVMVLTLWMLGLFFGGLKKRDPEIQFTVLSAAILLIGFGLDILYFHLFQSYLMLSLTSFGMLVFVAMQTVLMSKRYLKSLRQTAGFAKELKVLNANLENIVEERTAELEQKNQQLAELARTDPLTGLFNRRAFDEVIRKEIERSLRSGKTMVVSIIDLDNFKKVNDTFGHDAGDLVLKRVAKLLHKGLRSGDYSVRWGGEEFCILLPETDGEQALMVAERLKKLLDDEVFVSGEDKISITASFGLSVWQSGREMADVFKEADQALFSSKKAGRNRVTAGW